MSRDNKDLVVGLDIGTSKIVALVAEINQEGRLNVIGMGSQDSRGLKKGVVVNIEETVHTISRVVQEVELMADCKVKDVYTGIAGSHIKSFNSNGMVAIKDKEVTASDVERVIETAKAMPIPADQEILHILTQEFVIDGQDGIREPIGMSGMRLEVKTHIVTGAVSAAQNIVKCVRRCGLEVNDLVLQPLASSYAVLSEDEKDLGVCLIDIGGGTTDLAVWTQGAIRHTSVIPIAGDQITNDIAMALRTPTREAEDIKCKYGCALSQLADQAETMEVAGVDDRPSRKLSRRALADVIQPRVEELYELIRASCGAPASRRCCRPASSSPAVPVSCPVWSNWARSSSTCRCVSAARNTRAAWPTSCKARAFRPRSVCCSKRRRSASVARRSRKSRV